MVAAAVMSLTFTPVFYVVITRRGEKDVAPAGESAAES
jgi:hypothetical protein